MGLSVLFHPAEHRMASSAGFFLTGHLVPPLLGNKEGTLPRRLFLFPLPTTFSLSNYAV